MSAKIFKWGIMGCGNIAGQFATSLRGVSGAILHGVASRSEEKANEFARKYQALKSYGNYKMLAEDPEVDAIYIATPHNLHFENAMMCLNYKKAVLCEKPLTVNADEARQLIEEAGKRGTFLMEAFWTRFLPSTMKLNQLLNEGIIGSCRLVQADFGYNMPFDANHRSYNPDLAGGALLDVGIYPINFAQMIFREIPMEISSAIIPSITGVDEQSAYLFKYSSGSLAVLNSAVNVDTQHNAWIYGSDGFIHMPDFFHATKIHIQGKDGKSETISVPFESTGYGYEAIEVMNCVNTGKTESSIMPLSESLEIMKLMDTIRAQWGLKYPAEQ